MRPQNSIKRDMNRKPRLTRSISITLHTFHTFVMEDSRIEQKSGQGQTTAITAVHTYVKATLILGLRAPLVACNNMYSLRSVLVQSLNSPFFPPPIGAEPGRAERESRITCMRMLRTNQSKITRVHTRLLASMCRAIPFSARALKQKPLSLTLILL